VIHLGTEAAMLTIHFCLGDKSPVLRYWPSVPRIGDTVALAELGGNLDPLRVYDVIWECAEETTVSVYLHHTKSENPVDHDTSPHYGLQHFLRQNVPR
jgi:hypothetical protein